MTAMDDQILPLPGSGDLPAALLELNNAHALELSWLEPERFRQLADQAFRAWQVGEAEALLLSFDQDADYDSPNFHWFRQRLDRFIYVDRIVVSPQARGQGLARRLYTALFESAVQAGHERVVCEVNSHPPNPGSDAFHASLGFVRVGSAQVGDDGKTVNYLSRSLAPDT